MFVEDLSVFFADFGVPATLNGAAVTGIFDAAYAVGNVGIGMAGTQPVFTLATSGIVGEAVGQTLVVNAASYVVSAHEPDGTGMSRLLLEVAA
ncbi:MAG: hypothetical protein RL758_344 [Pseudomonadota bacterium]|jgi:hypothetical protein